LTHYEKLSLFLKWIKFYSHPFNMIYITNLWRQAGDTSECTMENSVSRRSYFKTWILFRYHMVILQIHCILLTYFIIDNMTHYEKLSLFFKWIKFYSHPFNMIYITNLRRQAGDTSECIKDLFYSISQVDRRMFLTCVWNGNAWFQHRGFCDVCSAY
jgi:hypothetical protein